MILATSYLNLFSSLKEIWEKRNLKLDCKVRLQQNVFQHRSHQRNYVKLSAAIRQLGSERDISVVSDLSIGKLDLSEEFSLEDSLLKVPFGVEKFGSNLGSSRARQARPCIKADEAMGLGHILEK
ncbi:hypothetical protein IGI04_029948 [Brassica rapa subsp. trilocularis]|uniref:DUF632 domain-containing protein n=1 Tax=Brassica rapa subsp. trilocularis TaxID=1813537 RepID=A0ABQ7LQ58_BRACM|nr:hypothetical protein IGI04_029948 [Brassica rapa subsp. trilocularis]